MKEHDAADERTCRRVVKRIVKISNDLYNVQKQHTNLQHDQTYFGLKDVKHLFTDDEVDYDPIFVRSSMEKGFEEYEIAGNRNMRSIEEHLAAIYHPLKN